LEILLSVYFFPHQFPRDTLPERRNKMSAIMPKGEKLRQAVKWISENRKEDESASISLLIEKAALQFNLSPKDEEFLRNFYKL